MTKYAVFICAVLLITGAINAQVPAATHLTILKAEDARRFDKTLEDLLKGKSEAVRIRAALAAGRIGNAGAIPTLSTMLTADVSPRARQMAAFALGEIESMNAADTIVKALESANGPKARLVEAAGKLIGANPNDPAAGKLREAILNVLEAESGKGAQQNRETVLLALTAALRAAPRDAKRARPDGTDTTVAKFLANPDARVRADAANTLSRVRAKNANEALRSILSSDADVFARANAARALGSAEDKAAVDLLINAAIADVDSRVRVSALRSLAALRDPKAGEPLLKRGEELLAVYSKAKKPEFIPAEHSEFLEIATALGRILPNSQRERAVHMFREFGKLDRLYSPEVYIAGVRIAPRHGDSDKPELISWRQYSTAAQVIGEFATLEPTTDEGKQMKVEAPDIIRPLVKTYAEADPVPLADTIMAAPDMLRAFAAFKTDDLGELLRTALTNKDLFVRATAAELIADLPPSEENLTALNRALEFAIVNDTVYNDAVLATLDALFKLDKQKSLPAMSLAIGSLDHLVRAKVADMLKDEGFKNVSDLPPTLKFANVEHVREVRPYSGKHTKLGQVLNTDADYRRAIARKNGRVSAVLTTAKGTFTIDLLPEDAPLTVDNFVKLAKAGYFNGLEVHRVVANFVMQDGDPRGDGNGGPGWSIRCEMNTVSYDRGAVGMALSGKDTGGSQWFVTHSPQPHLDGGYTVFGRVNETGMKVVDQIVRGDKIISVRIVDK